MPTTVDNKRFYFFHANKIILKLEITNHFKETFVGDNWKINCQKKIL